MLAGDYHSQGGGGSLSGYLGTIRKYPLLDAGEEKLLAERLRASGEKAAQDRLVTSHLRLVVTLARKYQRFGIPLVDLVAEGNIGLLQAAQRFDPSLGCRFATYATWWIKAAIQDFLMRSWSLVRLGTTVAQRRLFFGLEKAKKRNGIPESGDLADEDATKIASCLRVDGKEVAAMNQRLAGDVSLNREFGDSGRPQIDALMDESPDPEAQAESSESARLAHVELHRALNSLNPRERRILEERRLRDIPRKLDELSREYGISSERVRQIEHQALEKLRAAMTTRRHAALVAA